MRTKTRMDGNCGHPFIYPDGDCTACGRLATTLPGKVEAHHKMVPHPAFQVGNRVVFVGETENPYYEPAHPGAIGEVVDTAVRPMGRGRTPINFIKVRYPGKTYWSGERNFELALARQHDDDE